jgi:ABC-type multidrug transport system fused ATPase/permease subunit
LHQQHQQPEQQLSVLHRHLPTARNTPTCVQGEKVLATLRMELFRTLLMQKIEFFDRHSATQLQSLISVELDTVRTFIFK